MTDGYFVGINWNNDGNEFGGDFTDVGEDVTDDVLQRGPVTFQYGRDQSRALSPPQVGSIGFTLCNADGLFSPENPASPISSEIAPAAAIKVEETIGGVTYPLMQGHVDTLRVNTRRGDRSAQITGLDGLALLRGKKITTELYQAERTGHLIVAILDAAGAFFNVARRIDVGATHVPWWWANNQDAFDLLTQLVRAEGPPAVAYIDPDGGFVFRDRHHRLLNARSLVSQATFSDVSTVPLLDTFSRTLASGWGTADTGQTWTIDSGTAADFSVTAGVGSQIQGARGAFLAATVPAPGADVDLRVDFAVDAVPVSDNEYIFAMARFTDTSNFYMARMQITPAGAMTLSVRTRIAGVETQLAFLVLTSTYVAGAQYTMRFEVTGTTLRAKAWEAGDDEPFAWQVSGTDATFATAGSVGLRSLLGGATTNPLPVTFTFDNFQGTTPNDAAAVGCP